MQKISVDTLLREIDARVKILDEEYDSLEKLKAEFEQTRKIFEGTRGVLVAGIERMESELDDLRQAVRVLSGD